MERNRSPTSLTAAKVPRKVACTFLIASHLCPVQFNVYDTLSGTTGVGQFNVKSNGGAAPVP
jgi:hypothetical protein